MDIQSTATYISLLVTYFGHLMQEPTLWKKTLMLGKISRTNRGQQRMRWLDNIADSVDMNLSKFFKTVKDREAWCAAVQGWVAKSRTQFSD